MRNRATCRAARLYPAEQAAGGHAAAAKGVVAGVARFALSVRGRRSGRRFFCAGRTVGFIPGRALDLVLRVCKLSCRAIFARPIDVPRQS